jgi:hypothetical protein
MNLGDNMRKFNIARNVLAVVTGLLLQGVVTTGHAQTAEIKTEYLMTLMAPLDAPLGVDSSLVIVNLHSSGGWVKGPKIVGTLIAPGGDWLRITPSGALRLDVRTTLKTDDGALIYISYNGIVQQSAESAERMNKGELLTTQDIPYFITAPTFETSSPKYAWLNSVQAIGKMVELKIGESGHVKYDVFIAR